MYTVGRGYANAFFLQEVFCGFHCDAFPAAERAGDKDIICGDAVQFGDELADNIGQAAVVDREHDAKATGIDVDLFSVNN